MSTIQLPGPDQHPATPPPASGMLGLGVDVGLVVLPAAEPLPADGSAPDRFERVGANATPASRERETARQPVRVPVAAVRAETGAVTARRLVAGAVGQPAAVDPTAELQARLAACEAGLGSAHAAAFARVRLGLMLALADGQTAAATCLPISQRLVDGVAARVLARGREFNRDDHHACLVRDRRACAAVRDNVQAYVQRVLRECYLIQNQVLFDYAARVRHFNDVRAKTRDLLERARATRTAWATEAAGRDDFAPRAPFDWVAIGDDGVAYTPTLTAADVERERSAARADAQRECVSGAAVLADAQALYGDSQLTGDERELLAVLVRDKDTSVMDWLGLDPDAENDDYVCEHLDELLAILPRMNADELDRYLAPILGYLSGGDADEEELLEIFAALNPAQLLYLKSCGLHLDVFDEEEQADLDLIFRRAGRAAAEATGASFDGELDEATAARLLAAVQADGDTTATNASVAGAPAVGSPRQIRSLAGMDDYIKSLEEELCSTGDDAQLANVTLQNALQQQQQTLQMLSNVAKVLHDTALAIVRRINS